MVEIFIWMNGFLKSMKGLWMLTSEADQQAIVFLSRSWACDLERPPGDDFPHVFWGHGCVYSRKGP